MAGGKMFLSAPRRGHKKALPKVALIVSPKRIPRRRSGFARTQTIKMNYCEGIILNPAAALGVHQFRATSIFDPDITGGGHQPLSHDQWNAFYTRYKVTHVKMTVSYTDVTGATLAVCGINYSQSGTLPNLATVMCEQAGTRYRTIDDTEGAKKVSLSLPAWTLAGVTKNAYMSEADYGADFGASPANQVNLTMFAQHINEATAITVPTWVHLTYTVLLTEPELLLTS